MRNHSCLYEMDFWDADGTGPRRPGGERLSLRAAGLAGVDRGSIVLDVGCGNGYTVDLLARRLGARTFGIDPSEILVNQGRSRYPDAVLYEGRGEQLPFGSGIFDSVFAECSASLSDDRPAFLGEAFRVLKKGGRLVLSELYLKTDPETKLKDRRTLGCASGCMDNAESFEYWLCLIEEAGFRITALEDHSREIRNLAAGLVFRMGREQTLKLIGRPVCNIGYFLAAAEKGEDSNER